MQTESLRPNRGFSLVELLIVVGIIGILAGIFLVNAPEMLMRARMRKAEAEINTISSALAIYHDENRSLPPANRLVIELGKARRGGGGPYHTFGTLGDMTGTVSVEPISLFTGGGETQILASELVSRGVLGNEFPIDPWGRPYIYVPFSQAGASGVGQFLPWFDKDGNSAADSNETYYGAIRGRGFALYSVGPDGRIRSISGPDGPVTAPMPFEDQRDNDRDGLTDAEDTLKATSQKSGYQALPEDDIVNQN